MAEAAAEGKATIINTQIDPKIRGALDAYLADYNGKNEHQASIRSSTEAALKGWLQSKGFWPWPPEEPKAEGAKRPRAAKAGAA
jgi:hypothetical protein